MRTVLFSILSFSALCIALVQADSLVINGCELVPGTQCTHDETGLKYKNLKNLDLSQSDFSYTSFHGSSLDGSDLRDAILVGAEFDMGSIAGADLRGADLTDAFLPLARIHGADLRGATLFNVNLQYSDGAASARLDDALLCNTQLPDGTVSNRDCP